MQFRINAEVITSSGELRPQAGELKIKRLPLMPNVRIDTAIASSTLIDPSFDSMVLKLIVQGDTDARSCGVARGTPWRY